MAAVRIAVERLDLDDVGAPVPEHHGGGRSSDDDGQLDDADAGRGL